MSSESPSLRFLDTEGKTITFDRIYFHPINAIGEEITEPILIDLHPDGSADLSRLPEPLRSTLRNIGAPLTGGGYVKPTRGAEFLRALLETANGYSRFTL